jgi:hypothetical protein
MDAASAQAEAVRLREAVRDHRVAAASHRREARRAGKRLDTLEALCARHGITLTLTHAAEGDEHGGDRRAGAE